MEQYENQEGYRIVLTNNERQNLKESITNTKSRIAWSLASECGLRRNEIANVQYKHITQRDTGDYIVRVYEGKGDKYRETPCPSNLAVQIKTIEETADVDRDDHVIDHSMRTCIRHLQRAAENLQNETNKDGYNYVGMHDGRRTWANSLLDDDVSPLQVMEWGSWDDWQTFRDHYLQDFSEKHQSEEIEKVNWI